MPGPIPSWGVAAFANPKFNDLDIPENPGSIHVRSKSNPEFLAFDLSRAMKYTRSWNPRILQGFS